MANCVLPSALADCLSTPCRVCLARKQLPPGQGIHEVASLDSAKLLSCFAAFLPGSTTFLEAVVDDEKARQWVSEPPAEEGIEDEANKDSGSEQGINERHVR